MVQVDRSVASLLPGHKSEVTPDSYARSLLRQMFDAAVGAADPAKVLAQHLPPVPKGRCIVVGAGKAAASMAAAVEQCWPNTDVTGVVVVPYGYATDCRRITVREAGHPLPDDNSVAAAQEILTLVKGLGPDDLVLALISGGGSAAMCLPVPGLSLDDKRNTNRLLLSSGLDIRTINAVRRRISAIKGGKLAAAAAPAQVVTLAISDIPGDDPAAIASGPTVSDPDPALDLSEVIAKLGEKLPPHVAELLSLPGEPAREGSPADIRLIATPGAALAAAADVARAHGVNPIVLGDDIEGESRTVAAEMAKLVPHIDKPTVFISGGETTVTITGPNVGRGGRNTEFALALARALKGDPDIWALAADTDGEDGDNLGAAGAVIAPDTMSRACQDGLDLDAHLATHDSGGFFAALDDLVITGPTRTNVNDFRAILVLPSSGI